MPTKKEEVKSVLPAVVIGTVAVVAYATIVRYVILKK